MPDSLFVTASYGDVSTRITLLVRGNHWFVITNADANDITDDDADANYDETLKFGMPSVGPTKLQGA